VQTCALPISRLTVLLCANSTGSHKLRPLVIGSAKKPRSFNGINISQLPVMYRSNQKAWMRSDIWKEWLHYIDSGFRIQNRQVLLLVDNAASHTAPEASEIQDDTDELPLDNADADTENDSSEIERPQERSRGRPRGRRSRGRPRGGRSLGRLNITDEQRLKNTQDDSHN